LTGVVIQFELPYLTHVNGAVANKVVEISNDIPCKLRESGYKEL